MSGVGVPDPDRLVLAGGGDAATVGAERHAIDVLGVSLERERLLPGSGIPDLDRPSLLAEAMRRPSGLNATPMTSSVCPLNVSASCPEPASQTLTVLLLAEAMRRPSGLNATPLTCLLCPLSVSATWPEPASQTFDRPIAPAEAMRRPSGLNATPLTPTVVPLERPQVGMAKPIEVEPFEAAEIGFALPGSFTLQ